jgi:hypothetical protein
MTMERQGNGAVTWVGDAGKAFIDSGPEPRLESGRSGQPHRHYQLEKRPVDLKAAKAELVNKLVKNLAIFTMGYSRNCVA